MIGDLIKRYRKRAGMTQADLSEELGVDQGLVSRWERGKKAVPPARVPELADALDAPEADLLAAQGDPETGKQVRSGDALKRWRDALSRYDLSYPSYRLLNTLPTFMDENSWIVVVPVAKIAKASRMTEAEAVAARSEVERLGFFDVAGDPAVEALGAWSLQLTFPGAPDDL